MPSRRDQHRGDDEHDRECEAQPASGYQVGDPPLGDDADELGDADENREAEVDVPPTFRAVFILVFVLAAGVVWEGMKFTFGGLGTVYGIDDIVTDFVCNAVGAVIVAIWGTGSVTDLVGFVRSRLRSRSE